MLKHFYRAVSIRGSIIQYPVGVASRRDPQECSSTKRKRLEGDRRWSWLGSPLAPRKAECIQAEDIKTIINLKTSKKTHEFTCVFLGGEIV